MKNEAEASSHSHNANVDSLVEHVMKNNILISEPKKLKYLNLLPANL